MNDKAIIAGWMLDVRFRDIKEIERERDRARRAAQLLLDDIIHEMWWYGYDPSEYKIYVENYTLLSPILDAYIWEAFAVLHNDGWLKPLYDEPYGFQATQKFIDKFKVEIPPRSEYE